MRLAFCLFKYFPHSGLARDMLRIAHEAASRGHNVEIYARDWQGEMPADLRVSLLPGGGLTNHGRAESFVRRLGSRLRNATYDAVVGFNKMPGLDFYYAADACFAARARRRYPRAYELTPRYRSWRRLEESVFGPSAGARILLLSESSRLEYQAFYATAEQRLQRLPPTLDRIHRAGPLDVQRRAAVRAALGAGGGDNVLLMVGSGFHTKGVDRTLRALASLPPDLRVRTRLVVVGRGKTDRYRRLADELDLRENTDFAGGRDDVPELLRAADFLVHPARQENTGTVILEALAAGLPVLATANCGYARHVHEAQAGTVLESPFDQQAFERALRSLLLSSDRSLLARNAWRYGQDESLYRMPETAVDLIESQWEVGPALDFHGCVHPELAGSSSRVSRLDHWLGLDGEVFRRAPDRMTLRFEGGDRQYFLKAHFGAGWKEIFKNLVQLKLPVLDAGNEWLAIHLVENLGVPTLTAVAYGRGPGLPQRRSFIVTRALSGMLSLEQYAAQNRSRDPAELRRRRHFIRKAAATARILHDNGINHRDFYLCHFLFDPAAGEDAGLYLIDLHRAQVRHRTPTRWRVKDIGGLYYSAFPAGLTRLDRLRFIKAYTGADTVGDALADHTFWRRVAHRASALQRAERRRGRADPAGIVRSLN